MRKKVGGPQTAQRPSTLPAMDKVYEQQFKRSRVDAGPGGEENRNGEKSWGSLGPSALIRVERVADLLGVLRFLVLLTFVVRMVSHAWGYRADELS